MRRCLIAVRALQDFACGAALHLDSHTGRGHVHPYLRPLRGQTQQVCGLPQVPCCHRIHHGDHRGGEHCSSLSLGSKHGRV